MLLFGAQRLPKLGKSLGQSIRGFKQGLNEDVPPDEIEPAKPAPGSDAEALPGAKKSA
jgi:Sec-independent protein translocase protein TatA